MTDETGLAEVLAAHMPGSKGFTRGADWWECSCGQVLATWLGDAQDRHAAHLVTVLTPLLAAAVREAATPQATAEGEEA